MIKVNLKGFFKDVIIQNEVWASNGYFIFKKSILTKAQQKMLSDFPQDTSEKIEKLINIAEDHRKLFEDSRERLEFTPGTIFEYISKQDTYNVLCNDDIGLSLREDYYNFFISRGCKIFKGSNSISPTIIYKNGEFMGILLPVRTTNLDDATRKDYKEYINKLKEERTIEDKVKETIKQFSKKCLYISNNKAVVRNKPIKSVSDIVGNDNYKNVYVDLVSDNQGYVDVYVDLGIVCMALNTSMRLENLKEGLSADEVRRLDFYSTITLQAYKDQVNNSIKNMQFINVAEIKLMELAGESKEFIERLKQHRQDVQDLRDKEHHEREIKKQKEEREYIEEKNKLVDDMATEAEQSILKGEKVTNKEITIYKSSRYDSNTTSLILHMMKEYDIKVPLKTQGWINNALHDIYKVENEDYYSFHYYKASSRSAVFDKYLNQLINKVKEKYKNVA